MGRPLIGLPGRRKRIGHLAGFPESLHHLDVDLYFADYARSVLSAGGVPVHLPLDADHAMWIEHLDGIVLTGGADVDPARYGHDNHASETEPRRDELEFGLLDLALAAELPVLGICRGLQVINVHLGGTLAQHVPEHARYDVAPHTQIHEVRVARGSRLHGIYGDAVAVNSLHHQTIDELASGLTAAAHAEDGTVEAVELDGADLIAVQWHPEMMTHDDPAFAWLVDRADATRSVKR